MQLFVFSKGNTALLYFLNFLNVPLLLHPQFFNGIKNTASSSTHKIFFTFHFSLRTLCLGYLHPFPLFQTDSTLGLLYHWNFPSQTSWECPPAFSTVLHWIFLLWILCLSLCLPTCFGETHSIVFFWGKSVLFILLTGWLLNYELKIIFPLEFWRHCSSLRILLIATEKSLVLWFLTLILWSLFMWHLCENSKIIYMSNNRKNI